MKNLSRKDLDFKEGKEKAMFEILSSKLRKSIQELLNLIITLRKMNGLAVLYLFLGALLAISLSGMFVIIQYRLQEYSIRMFSQGDVLI